MNSLQNAKKNAILGVLNQHKAPLNSRHIAHLLTREGHDLSERSVRMYLTEFDAEGLTCSHGRRGRAITEKGIDTLHAAGINQSTGRISAKIDQMVYRLNFNLNERRGKVAVNTAIFAPEILRQNLPDFRRAFRYGFDTGNLACIIRGYENDDGMNIPSGKVGLCTVCTFTINGVMLQHGIPAFSRFGGLLEVRAGKARRFTETIDYECTTIDPLEIFIRSGMTDYLGAVCTGNGLIGADMCEFPAESRQTVLHLARMLEEIGMGTFIEIGLSGEPVMGIQISPGRFGAVITGGLNPAAAIAERGYHAEYHTLTGLVEYSRLRPAQELADNITKPNRVLAG